MTNFVAGLAIIAFTATGSSSLSLQTPPGSGHWEGSINVQGKELRLTIDLCGQGRHVGGCGRLAGHELNREWISRASSSRATR